MTVLELSNMYVFRSCLQTLYPTCKKATRLVLRSVNLLLLLLRNSNANFTVIRQCNYYIAKVDSKTAKAHKKTAITSTQVPKVL